MADETCHRNNLFNHLFIKLFIFLLSSENNNGLVKKMKQVMLTKVNEYYGEDCDTEVLDKAMLLDP